MTEYLKDQFEGNSRFVFLSSILPSSSVDSMTQILDFSMNAAKLYQNNIKSNVISADKSELFKIMATIEGNLKEVEELEFWIKNRRGSVV